MPSEAPPSGRSPYEDAAELAVSRGKGWSLLADSVLRAPVHAGRTADELAEQWQTLLGPVDPDRVAVLAAELRAPGAEVRMGGEFAALFEVQTARYLAPVESVYRNATFDGTDWQLGRHRGPAWFEVVDAYREAGFDLTAEQPVEADSLGCELQFMAALCRLEAQAWARGEEAEAQTLRRRQSAFAVAHLEWVRRLRQRAADLACAYYREVLELVERYRAVELDHLPHLEAA